MVDYKLAKNKQSIPKFYMKRLRAKSDNDNKVYEKQQEKRKAYYAARERNEATNKHW